MATRTRDRWASDVALTVAVACMAVHDLLRLWLQPAVVSDWVDAACMLIVAVTLWTSPLAATRVVRPQRYWRRFWVAIAAILVLAFGWSAQLSRREDHLGLDVSLALLAASKTANLVNARRRACATS